MEGHLRELDYTKKELFSLSTDVSQYFQVLHQQGMSYMQEKQELMDLKLNAIKRIIANMERVHIQRYQNQLDTALRQNPQHPMLNHEKQVLADYHQQDLGGPKQQYNQTFPRAAENSFNREWEKFSRADNNRPPVFADIDEMMELDINGTFNMSVNKSTLCKVPNSALTRFFTDQTNLANRRTHLGRIFVDR